MQPHTLHGLIGVILFLVSFLFSSKKIVYHAVLLISSLNVILFSVLGILTIETFTTTNIFRLFMFLVVGIAWYFTGEQEFYNLITEIKNRFNL